MPCSLRHSCMFPQRCQQHHHERVFTKLHTTLQVLHLMDLHSTSSLRCLSQLIRFLSMLDRRPWQQQRQTQPQTPLAPFCSLFFYLLSQPAAAATMAQRLGLSGLGSNAAQRAALQTARLESDDDRQPAVQSAEQPADADLNPETFAAAAQRASAEQVAMAEAQVS